MGQTRTSPGEAFDAACRENQLVASADETVDFHLAARLLTELLAEAKRRVLEVPDA